MTRADTKAATLILLCGTSFSGKSTLAAALAARLDARVVSYDAINLERGLSGGHGIARAEWQRTDAEAHRRAAGMLTAGGVVIVDDTSSPRLLRDRWRAEAAAAGARFRLVYVRADRALVTKRAEQNRHSHARADVVDAVMIEHLATFEPPGADEPHLVVDRGIANPATGALVDDLRR